RDPTAHLRPRYGPEQNWHAALLQHSGPHPLGVRLRCVRPPGPEGSPSCRILAAGHSSRICDLALPPPAARLQRGQAFGCPVLALPARDRLCASPRGFELPRGRIRVHCPPPRRLTMRSSRRPPVQFLVIAASAHFARIRLPTTSTRFGREV